MKGLCAFIILILVTASSQAELNLPPDIQVALTQSNPGESGGLFVHGTSEERLFGFIRENWREIAERIEELPVTPGVFDSATSQKNATVIVFGVACEWLPAEEYLEFLEKFTELREEGRIDFGVWKSQLFGWAKKDHFLAVNWQHPRVKNLLEKAMGMVPETETDTLEMLNNIAHGKLADSYLVNKPDDAPLPETLPGVKLKRPFASLISKYERLTGKRVPADPQFPEEMHSRPPRRSENGLNDVPVSVDMASALFSGRAKSLAVASFSLALILFVFLLILRKKRVRRQA